MGGSKGVRPGAKHDDAHIALAERAARARAHARTAATARPVQDSAAHEGGCADSPPPPLTRLAWCPVGHSRRRDGLGQLRPAPPRQVTKQTRVNHLSPHTPNVAPALTTLRSAVCCNLRRRSACPGRCRVAQQLQPLFCSWPWPLQRRRQPVWALAHRTSSSRSWPACRDLWQQSWQPLQTRWWTSQCGAAQGLPRAVPTCMHAHLRCGDARQAPESTAPPPNAGVAANHGVFAGRHHQLVR